MKILTFCFLALVATVDSVQASTAYSLTIRPIQRDYDYLDPVEVMAEVRAPREAVLRRPEGLSGNVEYEVEYENQGVFERVNVGLVGYGARIWEARQEKIEIANAPLSAAYDLKREFSFDRAGKYRVRGKYRSNSNSEIFDVESEWSEFNILPPTALELQQLDQYEIAGSGNTDTEKISSFRDFTVRNPSSTLSNRCREELIYYFYRTGASDDFAEAILDYLKHGEPSQIDRRLLNFELGLFFERRQKVDLAIEHYLRAELATADHRIERLRSGKRLPTHAGVPEPLNAVR